jgi:hypothetical protein
MCLHNAYFAFVFCAREFQCQIPSHPTLIQLSTMCVTFEIDEVNCHVKQESILQVFSLIISIMIFQLLVESDDCSSIITAHALVDTDFMHDGMLHGAVKQS